MGGLNYLLELVACGLVKIGAPQALESLVAVRNTLDWKGDDNRTFVIEFREEFDIDSAACFAAKMQYSLEHIEVA